MQRKSMKNRGLGKSKGRRGGALLETALVAPVLLGMIFGCIEYGYYFYMKNIGVAGAREGARALSLGNASSTTVQTAVDQVMATGGLQPGSYTVTQQDATPNNPVTVTVTMTWGTVGLPMPTYLGGIPSYKQLVATTKMMKE